MKIFVLSILFWVVVSVSAFSQTHMKMDLWVGRIPVVKDPTLTTTCNLQRVFIYTDPQRFGAVTETDTVALVVKKDLLGPKLWCIDLVSNDYFIFESYQVDTGFIIFLNPQEPLKAKYNLILSTTPCLESNTKLNVP